MAKQRIDVFISSTSIDLPEHRAAVRDAIITLGLHPSGMETWPVSGDNPVDLCHKMVLDAEIYLGIYAYRYGWQPDGYAGKSITELEYDWAADVKRDGKPIPRLCFIMKDSHPWPEDKKEKATQNELNRFKARVKGQQVGFFTSPDDLKAQVMAALAPLAQRANRDAARPYLRWLHEQSKQSGLLHVLNPRDTTSDSKRITVDRVYTPLNTRHPVRRDASGKLMLNDLLQMLAAGRQEEFEGRLKDGEGSESDRLTAMEAANLHPNLVLLGDPGSGKSTFINFLALCLSGHLLEAEAGWLSRLEEQGWEQGEKLPVVVTLRDFAQSISSDQPAASASLLFEHIERELSKWKLEEAYPVIEEALDSGNALVLLDGLDEVPQERRELVRDIVTDFITRSPHNRYLVTCRVLSYANPNYHLADFTDETIAPFDGDQITHFVNTWYTALTALEAIDNQTADQRIADLSEGLEHPHLQSVASNPMLLTVMAIVHNHTGALPRESARLYAECVDLLMLRWKRDEASSLLTRLNVREDDLYRLLWHIAFDAHDKQAEREGAADIPETAVIGLARKALGDDDQKAREFCEYVEKRAGLLIGRGQDAYGWRVFTFPHRTFQEYLAGCYAANNNFWELASELAGRGASWRETLLLATGHLVFNQQRTDIPLLAIDELSPAEEAPQTADDWRKLWLAGDMLALVGKPQALTAKKGERILKRICERLALLLEGGHLEATERAAAGRTLGLLGDPRPGVGVLDSPRPGVSVLDSPLPQGEGPGVRAIPDILWRPVPAGSFLYGDNKEPHPMDHDYEISAYPVTYAQYEPFVAGDGYTNDDYWTEDGLLWRGDKRQPEGYWNDPQWHISNHPVIGVTWYEAVAYCNWLTAQVAALTPGPSPSGRGESEMEESCREMATRALVGIARDLRQRSTDAEALLWECLRDRRLGNIKFRRQHPIANTGYVADFFCYEGHVVIELDGGIHEQQVEADAVRQREIESQGNRVLRFSNQQVFDDLETVLATISLTAFSDSPRPEGEGLGVRAIIRLPTETEWEKAARGTDGRKYPYAGDYNPLNANGADSGIGRTSAVGMFPNGRSPYEVLDMSGNVLEWCSTQYESGSDDLNGTDVRVLRGGSWNNNNTDNLRVAVRNNNNPDNRNNNVGFRCARPCAPL